MVNSDQLGTILVAAIPALISGLIGSGFLTSEYFRESIDPIIIIELEFFNSTDANLEIDNFGKSPATNFTLFFSSFNKIKDITNNLSVEHINITTKNNLTEEIIPIGEPKEIDDSYFELHVPELKNGGVKLVDFDIKFDSFENFTKYKYDINMIARYDQGSAEGIIIYRHTPNDYLNLNFYNGLTDLHYHYYLNYKEPFLVYLYVFATIFLIIEAVFFYIIRPYKGRKQRYIFYLLDLRKRLKENHHSNNYNLTSIDYEIYREILSPYWKNKLYPIEFYTHKNNYEIYRLMFDLRYNLELVKNTHNIPDRKYAFIESIRLIESIIAKLDESKKSSLSSKIIKKE